MVSCTVKAASSCKLQADNFWKFFSSWKRINSSKLLVDRAGRREAGRVRERRKRRSNWYCQASSGEEISTATRKTDPRFGEREFSNDIGLMLADKFQDSREYRQKLCMHLVCLTSRAGSRLQCPRSAMGSGTCFEHLLHQRCHRCKREGTSYSGGHVLLVWQRCQ